MKQILFIVLVLIGSVGYSQEDSLSTDKLKISLGIGYLQTYLNYAVDQIEHNGRGMQVESALRYKFLKNHGFGRINFGLSHFDSSMNSWRIDYAGEHQYNLSTTCIGLGIEVGGAFTVRQVEMYGAFGLQRQKQLHSSATVKTNNLTESIDGFRQDEPDKLYVVYALGANHLKSGLGVKASVLTSYGSMNNWVYAAYFFPFDDQFYSFSFLQLSVHYTF